MKAEDFKNEFDSIKKEISFLIDKLELKFTTEEILNFDSITFKDIQIDLSLDEKKLAKQDYLILGNESYDVFEFTETSSKTITKKTRSTIFSIKKSKILKMKEEDIFNILLDYTKLIALYDRYKLLREELDNFIVLNFPEIETWYRLTPVFGFQFVQEKIDEIANKKFNDYFDLQSNLRKKEKLIYQERSSFLENKLKK